MSILIKKPQYCSKHELEEFKELVEKGGQVIMKTLPNLLKKSHLLAFYYDDTGALKGVGGVKCPNNSYKTDVFTNAGCKDIAEQYDYELGWISVEEDSWGKGIGSDIISQLLTKVSDFNLYATTSSGNNAMIHLLSKCGFEKTNTNNGRITLFIKKAT